MTARQELFVPKGDACELDRVTVCNGSTVVKELDLFSYVEFCLWDAVDDGSNFQRNYSTGEVEVEGSVIYHKTEYREPRPPAVSTETAYPFSIPDILSSHRAPIPKSHQQQREW